MKRRKFIKLGLLGSSSVLAYSPSLGTIQASSDTLNVGVIGTGSRGQGLLSLINKAEGINTIACSDILPFRLAKGLAIASKYGKAKGYKNYKKLLDNKDLDCVFIS